MRSAIIVFVLIVAVSCEMESNTPIVRPQTFDQKKYIETLNPKPSENISHTVEKTNRDSIQTETIDTQNLLSSEISDTVYVDINYGQAEVKTVKRSNRPIVFVFDSDTANKLDIEISSIDSLNNLVVSQISDKHHHSIRPMTKKIEDFSIESMGIHKVKVEQINTQGKFWKGEFTFKINLKW